MAFIGLSVLLDFVSSLAVLGLLVVGYSALGPRIKEQAFAPLILGALFGLVVDLQMSMPLSPADGVIVDMRNVPIVLAGAFLGARGLAICLVLAIGARIGLGGVGMLPGVVGMLIAGAVGIAWSYARVRITAPDWVKLLGLGIAVNLHMASAFLASAPIIEWYFTEAATTIFVLNLLYTPLIGYMLLREQKILVQTEELSAAAMADPRTRLLRVDAFANEISHFNASDPDRRISGVVAVTLKNKDWLKQTWGAQAFDQSLGALRVRFAALCQDGRPLGIDGSRRLLVPVTEIELRDLRPFRRSLRKLATDTPVRLSENVVVPLTIIAETFNLTRPDTPAVTKNEIRRSAASRKLAAGRSDPEPRHRHTGLDPLPKGLTSKTVERLFQQAAERARREA
ncbi:LytS/YhcK type 5TM receptor domain-containing protein [Tateyamaria sp. SN6-1]|uniref:LytS/YhcK type 5TM receptor domain-containing protein n=1 Tax=Tateyamaria sp. SN6-1 TaxID=3092148 RepID=UPI0039F636D7